MARCIDADKFMSVLNDAQIEFSDTYEGLGRAKFLLSLQPTADVVPKSEVESIITEIADFIWQGESEKMNFPFNNHYYNKQEFIAKLKNKYTEVDDAGK